MSEYDYEYEYDSKYCYPGSKVLINKLGIKDAVKLSHVERDATFIKSINLLNTFADVECSLEYFCKIHRFLFEDIYEWAGHIRTVNISKGSTFCRCEYIESNLQSIFRKMNKEEFFKMDSECIATVLAHYLGEINAVHPFREGNGRTQRVFINQIAMKYGYILDFSQITEKEMLDASHHSFVFDDSKMIALFKRVIQKMQ